MNLFNRIMAIGGGKRESNIELLRLISMIMVMVVHANSLANRMPMIVDLPDLSQTLTRIMVQTFANVNVDVFVLISGWFGIKFTMKGVANILFQCLFYTLVSLCIVMILWPDSLSLFPLFKSIYFGSCYWFVVAYLGLMTLSPVLNRFVECSERKQIKTFLFCYFVYQAIYGWLSLDEAHFIYGYSFASFVGLYVLARYIRLYRPGFSNFGRTSDFILYCLCSLASGTAIFIALCTNNASVSSITTDKMLSYNSPLCICAALFLLLCFSKMNLKSNTLINGLASSCFAIYLIHCNALILPHYLDLMRNLYQQYSGVSCLLIMFVTILVLSFFFIFIDKFRITIYDVICRKKYCL